MGLDAERKEDVSIQNRNQGEVAGNINYLEQLQQEKNIELWTEEVKNGMEIHKKQILEDVKSENYLQRTRDLADIASKRELQRTLITFSVEKDVILQKECFGENIKGRLPIKIIAAKLFCHLNDTERVLSVLIRKDTGDECNIFWNCQKSENRWIRRLFEENGISFGFGEKKENEIRRKLLLAIASNAERIVLPERHGWWLLNDGWKYIFPDEVTWEEVDRGC